MDGTAYYVTRGPSKITKFYRSESIATDWGTHAGAVRAMVADGNNVYVVTDGFGPGPYAGLYKLVKANWGGGMWERLVGAFDPQGLVDMGDALVFTEAGNGGAIRHTAKDTWLTESVISPWLSDVRGQAVRDCDWVCFARFGLGTAFTWTSEVYRVRPASKKLELVASSLVHAVGVGIRGMISPTV